MERELSPDDMKALVKGIGLGLRTQHADVFTGEIPERIAELSRQLDQPATARRSGP
jgi:hypothetical protein